MELVVKGENQYKGFKFKRFQKYNYDFKYNKKEYLSKIISYENIKSSQENTFVYNIPKNKYHLIESFTISNNINLISRIEFFIDDNLIQFIDYQEIHNISNKIPFWFNSTLLPCYKFNRNNLIIKFLYNNLVNENIDMEINGYRFKNERFLDNIYYNNEYLIEQICFDKEYNISNNVIDIKVKNDFSTLNIIIRDQEGNLDSEFTNSLVVTFDDNEEHSWNRENINPKEKQDVKLSDLTSIKKIKIKVFSEQELDDKILNLVGKNYNLLRLDN